MRIAICDDEDQERLNIEALVNRIIYCPFFLSRRTAGSSEDDIFPIDFP